MLLFQLLMANSHHCDYREQYTGFYLEKAFSGKFEYQKQFESSNLTNKIIIA